jgi:hypothetical protein
MNQEEETGTLFWHRAKFLALITVFLSPFIGGWMALYVFDIKPSSGNYGTLITPVKTLDWPELKTLDGDTHVGGFGRKWTLLLFAGEDCAELCRSNLFYMRQLRTLLGRDTLRLQNVLISAQPLAEVMQVYLKEFPNLKVVTDYRDSVLYRQFELPGMGEVGSTPKMYLVDPDQNLMMHYPADNDQNRVLEDVKKLLKLSQIG